MTHTSDPRVAIFKALVTNAGGPAEFARKYSQDDADKPIDATYVSQIINGHRPFRDKSRVNMARRAGLPDDYFELPGSGDLTNKSDTSVQQDRPIYDLIPEVINKVVDVMKRLQPDDRNKILAFALFTESEYNAKHQNSTKRAGQ